MKHVASNKISGIYAITPDKSLDIDAVKKVLVGHKINSLQYRRKINNQTVKFNEAFKLRQLCWQYNTLFIINDDVNLTQKVHADGVHLGQKDTLLKNARQQLGDSVLIGVSCYNDINLAKTAQQQGANYVAFGALFQSITKPNALYCPLSLVSKAKQQLSIPIVGIGGIDFDNQHRALDAGCNAVAMIGALFGKTDH